MRIIKIIIAVIFVSLTSHFSLSAQTTTSEEYDYVTKGYSMQVEGGLDMKQGYVLQDLGTWAATYADGSRGFHFIGLYRGADKKPCAIMAIYEKKDNGATRYAEYYCIPTMDATDLWARTQTQLNANITKDNANEVMAGMVWGLMKLASQEAAK